ncbi:MAG TPA: multifunctional oxoglutarate decarboxylase/oxoglutarate dehydrogenase thiamine pyrophosphate-binding subunit/dihydrolipoyllysine-residue succinyltransferase subunit [Actinomycetota bacterium]|jgi:2-oxoglutarate dehydrogenase E1 component|nr:multifunctional oxoglutarate decarboxylase/oxoglutarate dehydrogenase thiamine pyrophosphate-binding subunit/dihydrolipoyllysine-residue succinyltransferase subunit [Actinomycetota bacterium]
MSGNDEVGADADQDVETEAFGPNTWLVDEMFRRYQEDPRSVDESWADFFEDFRPPGDGPSPEPVDVPPGAEPLRGAAARIVENMRASLEVPTATSVRFIPAKLLEENRRVLNGYLSPAKVSFTHILGWAVVNALEAVPAMKASFLEVDGAPHVLRRQEVNLGLAVDVERKDGTHTLLVPNVKRANEFDFAGFWRAYEDVIRKTRSGKLTPEDFAGTTATITNPGTVGTQLSVPRLLPGQSVIVGIGRVDYPSDLKGADPSLLGEIGAGKVVGVTSTYDHRVIQGAESGEFLGTLERLLLGEEFYDEIFASLEVPYEPVRWTQDRATAFLHDATPHARRQASVLRLVNMYRVRGHLVANINPLGSGDVLSHPELDLEHHGLSVWDLDRSFFMDPGEDPRPLREILDQLRAAYCQTVGVEYMHIQEHEQKGWIRKRVEGIDREPSREEKRHILERLNAAEAFEQFLHTKYIGHRRYGLEGSESLIPMLDVLLEEAIEAGMERALIGMAHRGRLNVLANIVGKSHERIFREFEGDIDPESIHGSGDVQYHVGTAGKFTGRSEGTIEVEMASNPSHLEAVDPVLEGIARAAQDQLGDRHRVKVLPVLLHGDAAFAGQGVVAETLGMSALPGFRTGGTVHIVVNNQLGFTTDPEAGRSSVYATDVAKMVQAPILHVNADDPEGCVWAVRLAFAFRQTFHKDVVVDLVCYRRFGHNEADDPSYTQPVMYAKIEEHRSVRKRYMEQLINRGDITMEDAEAALRDYRGRLEQAFAETNESRPPERDRHHAKPTGVLPPTNTGVERGTLERILEVVTSWPDDFTPHPKLAKQLEKRRGSLEEDRVDWSLAEALAFGSLVLEGIPVRLSGQDSRRGTFSQRHAVLVDYETGREYFPLANLSEDQAPFWIYDTPLNEFAALGFEYGYSVQAKEALVAWEAQFGDFVNEGQVVVDQFIVAGEDKWGQTSGLVVLLPHGSEGQGPEHSSGRIERFLTLSAEDNIQVAVPTTPAQYFHLLRRQMRREIRKPLVAFTPKSFLRLAAASSTTDELVDGHFVEVLPDAGAPDAERVGVVLLCSGKIFYDIDRARQDGDVPPVGVVRLEQLYPFPEAQILEAVKQYPNAREVRWVQEEPENMGAYAFVHARLHRALPDGIRFRHVARPESGSPAPGIRAVHEQEQATLLQAALADL